MLKLFLKGKLAKIQVSSSEQDPSRQKTISDSANIYNYSPSLTTFMCHINKKLDALFATIHATNIINYSLVCEMIRPFEIVNTGSSFLKIQKQLKECLMKPSSNLFPIDVCFPSLFLYFVSEENLKSAESFILKDKYASEVKQQLIASFVVNYFPFQNILHSTFFSNMIMKSDQNLQEALNSAMETALHQLSIHHKNVIITITETNSFFNILKEKILQLFYIWEAMPQWIGTNFLIDCQYKCKLREALENCPIDTIMSVYFQPVDIKARIKPDNIKSVDTQPSGLIVSDTFKFSEILDYSLFRYGQMIDDENAHFKLVSYKYSFKPTRRYNISPSENKQFSCKWREIKKMAERDGFNALSKAESIGGRFFEYCLHKAESEKICFAKATENAKTIDYIYEMYEYSTIKLFSSAIYLCRTYDDLNDAFKGCTRCLINHDLESAIDYGNAIKKMNEIYFDSSFPKTMTPKIVAFLDEAIAMPCQKDIIFNMALKILDSVLYAMVAFEGPYRMGCGNSFLSLTQVVTILYPKNVDDNFTKLIQVIYAASSCKRKLTEKMEMVLGLVKIATNACSWPAFVQKPFEMLQDLLLNCN